MAQSETLTLRFHKDDDLAWGWLPCMARRVAKFCTTYDSETLPHEAEDLIRAWFFTGDIRLGLWGVIHKDLGLVAHLFGTAEPSHLQTFRHTLVRQAEVDPGVDIRKESEEAFRQFADWTKSLGLLKILALTHRNTEVMFRRWSFQCYKSLLVLDLDRSRNGSGGVVKAPRRRDLVPGNTLIATRGESRVPEPYIGPLAQTFVNVRDGW